MKHNYKHKKIGQWCTKCEKYIGKVKQTKKSQAISTDDYLR